MTTSASSESTATIFDKKGSIEVADTSVLQSAGSAYTDVSFDYVPNLYEILSPIPSEQYDLWIKVGMVLNIIANDKSDKSIANDAEGLKIWDQWSSTSENYSRTEIINKWRSFNPKIVNGLKIGTLIQLSNEHKSKLTKNELLLRQSALDIIVNEDASKNNLCEQPPTLSKSKPTLEQVRKKFESQILQCIPASPSHPYLLAKGITNFSINCYEDKENHPALLIPIQNFEGITTGMQRIWPDGTKKYVQGSIKSGSMHPIGQWRSAKTVLVCEGFATGATLHKIIKKPVLVAMDSSNLKRVCEALHSYNSAVDIIVCGDDDKTSPSNPGRMYAEKAATAIGAKTAFPETDPNCKNCTDFNDVAQCAKCSAHQINGLTLNTLATQSKYLKNNKTGVIKERKAADLIIDYFKNLYRYDTNIHNWFSKETVAWLKVGDEAVIRREIDVHLKLLLPDGYSEPYRRGILKFLRDDLPAPTWQTDERWLPMNNGVFDLKTNNFSLGWPTSMDFNWQLPCEYDATHRCPEFDQWLTDTSGGDKDVEELLEAWMVAVIRGRFDLQKYLEVHGPGGTGKSTFLDICTLLVGEQNTCVTNIKALDSQFGTTPLYNKRLALITDAGRHGGDGSTIKAITGGDKLKYERKRIDPGTPFKFRGLLMIATNELIQTSDLSDAIKRRRIRVELKTKVSNQQIARYQNRGGIIKALKSELPGIVNRLLKVPEAVAVDRLRNLAKSLQESELRSEIQSNDILLWARSSLERCDQGEESLIGARTSMPLITQLDRLYPNYYQWMKNQNLNPVSMKRFSTAVELLLKQQGIVTKKSRIGEGTKLDGLKLRADNSKVPYLF